MAIKLIENIKKRLREQAINKERELDINFLRCNSDVKHPKFMDIRSPVLITGMVGSGPVFFSAQLGLQAAKKGYVVVDMLESFSPDIMKGFTSDLMFIEDDSDVSEKVEGSLPALSFSARYNSYIYFHESMGEKVNEVLHPNASFSDLLARLSEADIPLLILSGHKNASQQNNCIEGRKIVVSYQAVDDWHTYKNRFHMRDTLSNHYGNGNVLSTFHKLHNSKVGHGVIIIDEEEHPIEQLYWNH